LPPIFDFIAIALVSFAHQVAYATDVRPARRVQDMGTLTPPARQREDLIIEDAPYTAFAMEAALTWSGHDVIASHVISKPTYPIPS
jgi:hypothetical protein